MIDIWGIQRVPILPPFPHFVCNAMHIHMYRMISHNHRSSCSLRSFLQIVVPDYTKHCHMCEHCVSGFDHHCQWLMKCVGHNNHRLFVILLFVVAMATLLFVITAISCKLYSGGDGVCLLVLQREN